jgi:RHS repeat-associated protein
VNRYHVPVFHNRLATASATWPDTTQQYSCWNYDPFGNRLQQEQSSETFAAGSGGATTCTAQSGATLATDLASYSTLNNNRIASTNARGVTASPTYDLSGNLLYDGVNYYFYDGEGRICAMQSYNYLDVAAYGYLYDADGTRVSKGSITPVLNPAIQPLSCDPTANGFQFSQNYVLGPSGEDLTMFSVAGGVTNWQRTNVYAAGKLLATYDTTGLHFHLTDPLGTRRMQLSGNLANLGQPETDFQSLPFGDQLNTFSDQYAPASADDATPLHFTGKERDTESGNDYFGARYYSSAMGRFMSPDPSQLYFADPTNPQSLNLYSYVQNNPLVNIDPDGLDCIFFGDTSGTISEIDHGNSAQDASDCANAPGGGGQWVNGYTTESQMAYNSDTDSWNVASSDQNNVYFTAITQADPTCSTNCQTSYSQYSYGSAGDQLVAGSMSDFLQWLPANGVPNSRPGAQYPLSSPENKVPGNNYCGRNGAGTPASGNDWACAVHDYNYFMIGGPGKGYSFFSNPSNSVLTTPLLRQADANLATHVFGAEGLAIKSAVAAGAANTWVHNLF